MDHIIIYVNDESHSIPSHWTLDKLVCSIYANHSFIVVQYNQSIIENKNQYANIALKANDRVELITFMGGGC